MASHERFLGLLACIASEHKHLRRQCDALTCENEELRAQLAQGPRFHQEFSPTPPEAIVRAPFYTPPDPVTHMRTRGWPNTPLFNAPPVISSAAATLLSTPRSQTSEPSIHANRTAMDDHMEKDGFMDSCALNASAFTPRRDERTECEEGQPPPVVRETLVEDRPAYSQKSSATPGDRRTTIDGRPEYSEKSTASSGFRRTTIDDRPEISEKSTASSGFRRTTREERPEISEKRTASSRDRRTTRADLVLQINSAASARSNVPIVEGADIESLCRIMARLGVLEWQSTVTVDDLFNAVQGLGLTRYGIADIARLVDRINEFYPSNQPATPKLYRTASLSSHIGSKIASFANSRSESEDFSDREIPFEVLALLFFDEGQRRRLGKELAAQLFAIKEVLVSGEANRLVAHLTNLRVDDLAALPPRAEWYNVLEPIVGVLVVLNGVSLGVQTDPEMGEWDGWIGIESAFTLAFLFEMIFRICMVSLKDYFCGEDKVWNLVDACIILTSIVDIAIQTSDATFGSSESMIFLRVFRLSRLSRLIRIFRLGILRELRLMVIGLLAGFRTLFWAIVLLFFTIYVVALLATMTLATSTEDPRVVREEIVSSMPRAMLTCFRCFVGDCTTSRGEPIVKILSDTFGISFVLVYLFSFTLVTFGIFNLIMAIYVEMTLAAGKRPDYKDRNQAMRESLRIAQLTKTLLKKIYAVHHLVTHTINMDVRCMSDNMKDADDFDEDIFISKDQFLLIVQNPEVQYLMDQLEIPPERAELFDTLDAEKSGGLQMTELVRGLLKVRGELRKTDAVAALLAVHGAQRLIRSVLSKQEQMMDHLGITLEAKGYRE